MPARFAFCQWALHSVRAINVSHAAGAYAIGRCPESLWVVEETPRIMRCWARCMQHCAQHGPNCSIVTYFSRKCFSLAIPPGTGSYYWATRDTMAEAREAVMDHCLASGRSCEVKVAFCDARARCRYHTGHSAAGADPTRRSRRARKRIASRGSHLFGADRLGSNTSSCGWLRGGDLRSRCLAEAILPQGVDFSGSTETAERYQRSGAVPGDEP